MRAAFRYTKTESFLRGAVIVLHRKMGWPAKNRAANAYTGEHYTSDDRWP